MSYILTYECIIMYSAFQPKVTDSFVVWPIVSNNLIVATACGLNIWDGYLQEV